MPASPDEAIAQSLTEALESGTGHAPFDPVLREAGLDDVPTAWASLERLLQLLQSAYLRQLLPDLLRELSLTADPGRALRNLARFIAQSFNPYGFGPRLLGSEDLLTFLVRIFGFSQFLADALVRNPEYLEWLRAPDVLNQPKVLAQYLQEAGHAVELFEDPARRRDALCRFQRKELLRIGVRDIFSLGTLTDLTAELSDLAEAIIGRIVEEALESMQSLHGRAMAEDDPSRPSVFGVVAMGKLGGRELNFSSDVDLIFVYSDEGSTSGVNQRNLTNHAFFTRVGEEVIRKLSQHDEEGFLYRVDMRLRPDGDTGPLVRSIAGMETYYLTQARSWERLAITKARVICGGSRIEKPFQALADHFAYGQPLGTEILGELANLKARIDEQVIERGHAGREVKRGTGGIREIEFIVGAMQLMHGRARKQLRVKPTMHALDLIEQSNLLPAEDCRLLREAYVFLRNVEHRLQMLAMAQTHTLPQSEAELRQLALRCGIRGDGRQSPAEAFRQLYSSTTQGVHQIFERIFGQGTGRDDSSGPGRLLDPSLPANQRFEILKTYRFKDPTILATFDALARGHKESYLSATGQQFFETILPKFLEECAQTPLPEQAVRMFDNFLLRLKGITATYSFIAEQPLALHILLSIFGTSEYMGRILQSHPEFIDVLLDPESLLQPPDPQQMRKQALRLVKTRSGADLQAALCRFREMEFLAAGARRLEEVVPLETTGRTLSNLADDCLEAALQAAAAEMAAAENLPALPSGLAILSMGKLAIREINFFSDLDLVFIHGDAPSGVKDPHNFFARWAQRVVALISAVTPAGFVFKIDARLRPEGKNAPLVAPVSRYADYYAHRAQPWEFQSIIRCRHSAGDSGLSDALRSSILQPMSTLQDRVDLAREVRLMRKRLEDSVRLPSWARTDFKRSRGGVVDLEFLVQFLQLKGLGGNPALFTHDFKTALKELQNSSLLDPSQVQLIEQCYGFLRTLEFRSRLLFSTAASFLPEKKDRLEPLEFFMRDIATAQESFLQTVTRVMNTCRSLFDELVQ